MFQNPWEKTLSYSFPRHFCMFPVQSFWGFIFYLTFHLLRWVFVHMYFCVYYEHRLYFDNLFVLFSCFFLLALGILCYFIFKTLFLFFCRVLFYFYFSYCIKYQSGLENIIIKLEIVDLLLGSNIKVSVMPMYWIGCNTKCREIKLRKFEFYFFNCCLIRE